MNKQQLATLAILLLAGGLVLAIVGGYKVFTNLPVSVEQATNQANQNLSGKRDPFGNPMNRSIMGAWQVKNAELEAQMENESRAAKRGDAMPLLISGVVLLLFGGVLYFKTSPGKKVNADTQASDAPEA